MNVVMEHFGIGFLELLGAVSITGIIVALFNSNGMINYMICEYFQKLCG